MRVSSCCRRLALLGVVLLFGPATLFPILGQEPGVRGVGVRQQTLIAPVSPRPSVGNAGLFVGVNQFSKQSGLGTLQFAVHDAIELAFAFVVELQLIPPQNCWLLIEGVTQRSNHHLLAFCFSTGVAEPAGLRQVVRGE